MHDPDDAARRAQLADALDRTGRRDARAFHQLYRMTAAKLFGICLRICGERKAAEDVLQEVYLTVWTRADGYDRARGGAMTWLAAIARNRAIDSRRAQRPALHDESAVAELRDERPDASDVLLLDERERRLHACLDELDERQRAAIRAAFFQGATYAELAARQDVPLGTMKSWVRRGLLRLRECLDDDG